MIETASKARQAGASLPEQLLQLLFRLLQVVRIHQPNNQLFQENLAGFRRVLAALWAEAETIEVRSYRGRTFFNGERVNTGPAAGGAGDKMSGFLEERRMTGLGFTAKGDIADKDIIKFIELLSGCRREENPLTWLQARLGEENIAWVEPLTATDDPAASKKPGPKSAAAGPADSGGPPEEAPEDSDKSLMVRHAYRKALGAVGRKAYSHALGHVTKIGGEITGRKRAGIQKSKRAVQDMIFLLNEDESILLGMSTLRDYDDYTFTHSVNVAILAMCLGKRLGLSKLYLEYLGLCGLFHDLGKVDVPIELIRKPGGFTDKEYEVVKSHPLNSVRHIIQFNASPALKLKILLPPFEHHLGADHSGYPRTDRQDPISLLGRILAIADQYDAMNSSRAYRLDPISPERALQIMIDSAGAKLDPLILKVFINMIGVYPIGTLLLLDTGEAALVMEVPEKAEEGRPIVRLLVRTEEDKFLGGEVVDLAERDTAGAFTRNVLRCFHPSEYGLQPADFLIP